MIARLCVIKNAQFLQINFRAKHSCKAIHSLPHSTAVANHQTAIHFHSFFRGALIETLPLPTHKRMSATNAQLTIHSTVQFSEEKKNTHKFYSNRTFFSIHKLLFMQMQNLLIVLSQGL